MMKSIRVFKLATILLAFLFVACAAEPDSSQKGSCSLSCGAAKVGGIESIAERMIGSSVSLACAAGTTEMSNPVTLKWKIYEQVKIVNSQTGSGETMSASLMADGEREYIKVPRPSIAFEPFVTGTVNTSKTAGEHLDANSNPSPAKYAGVVTPSDEWCTDTCGVATIEVWPACGGSFSVGILAGPIDTTKVDIAVAVTGSTTLH